MTGTDSRRGASNLGVPLMLVAFVLMGGFMYWLSQTAEPTAPMVMEEDTADAEGGLAANRADLAVLERNPERYLGQMVRVENVPFAQGLGETTFFVNMPGGSPFLVRMAPDLAAAGETLPSGHVVLVGRIHEMTDSLTDAWIESGSVSEGNRVLVDFATHFLEAERILPGRDPAEAAGADTTGSGNSPAGESN